MIDTDKNAPPPPSDDDLPPDDAAERDDYLKHQAPGRAGGTGG